MNLKLIEKIKIIFTHVVLPLFMFVFVSCVVEIVEEILKINVNILITQTIANILFLIIMIPIFILFRKKYKLVYEKPEIKTLIHMVPIAIGLSLTLNIILGLLIPNIDENEVSNSLLEISENISIFISLFIVALITPITEELLFRGFIYDGIKLLLNKYIAIILTALIFAVSHGNFEQGIYALIVGLFFGYIIEKYQNIWYTIVIHCVMNGVIAIFQVDLGKISDNKSMLFLLFISSFIFIFSIIRINIRKEGE